MGGLKCYYLLRVLKHTVGAREKNLVDHARQRAPELGFVIYMHIIYLHRRARESAGKCAGMLGGGCNTVMFHLVGADRCVTQSK